MKRVGLFLARRIAGGALTVFVVVTLTFLMYWALAPQPGRFVYPVGIKITDYELSDGAHRLGADRPRLTQYGDWWWRLLHGDFGHMWTGATCTVAYTRKKMSGNAITHSVTREMTASATPP